MGRNDGVSGVLTYSSGQRSNEQKKNGVEKTNQEHLNAIELDLWNGFSRFAPKYHDFPLLPMLFGFQPKLYIFQILWTLAASLFANSFGPGIQHSITPPQYLRGQLSRFQFSQHQQQQQKRH